MLLAQCCEDDVLKYVLKFVEDNIKNEEWRHRDAAVMAFGMAGIICFEFCVTVDAFMLFVFNQVHDFHNSKQIMYISPSHTGRFFVGRVLIFYRRQKIG